MNGKIKMAAAAAAAESSSASGPGPEDIDGDGDMMVAPKQDVILGSAAGSNNNNNNNVNDRSLSSSSSFGGNIIGGNITNSNDETDHNDNNNGKPAAGSSNKTKTIIVNDCNIANNSSHKPIAEAQVEAVEAVEAATTGEAQSMDGQSKKQQQMSKKQQQRQPQKKQQLKQEEKCHYYGETAMNMCLLDPVRYGWTACGGVANVVSKQHVYNDTTTGKSKNKLCFNVVVEFPLEPVPPRMPRPSSSPSPTTTTTTATTKRKDDIAMFRDTIPWDLGDPQTPSPMIFATSISEMFGLDYDRMLELALSIEQQIDMFVSQHCQYAEPVTLTDPHHGEPRDHLGPLLQPYRYDPVIIDTQPFEIIPNSSSGGGGDGDGDGRVNGTGSSRFAIKMNGKEGMIKPGYSSSSRRQSDNMSTSSLSSSRHNQYSILGNDNNSISTSGGKGFRDRAKGFSSSSSSTSITNKKMKKTVKIGDTMPNVEIEYIQEVKKRLLEASILDTKKRHFSSNASTSTTATAPDGKTNQQEQQQKQQKYKLQIIRDVQCHICHKKRPIVYMFGCGMKKHMYCKLHLESRIASKVEMDEFGNYYLDECPVCTLQCTCSLCVRKTIIIGATFKASCAAQRASPGTTNFPSILFKSQSTEASDAIREIHTTPVQSEQRPTKQKTPSKVEKQGLPKKRSPEKPNSSEGVSRRTVLRPPLIDFPQEFHKGLDLELQIPEWTDAYFTAFSSNGQEVVNSLPEAWVETRRKAKTSGNSTDGPIPEDDGNVSYCHKCRLPGNLVCCDVCPRAFHQQCLDNMAEMKSSNRDCSQWECPVCPQERVGFDHDTVDGSTYLSQIETIFNYPSTVSSEEQTRTNRILSVILESVEKLIKYDFGQIFSKPANPDEVKGYQQIIESPMDLGTLLSNIQNGIYAREITSEHSTDDLLLSILKDIYLCFHNCLLFNKEGSAFARMAKTLLRRAEAIHAKSLDSLLSDDIKVKLSMYKQECYNIRQKMNRPGGTLIAQGVCKEDALKIFKPSSAAMPLSCPALKRTINKHVALLDPVHGRVVKIYISLSHATMAVQIMRSKGHPSEENRLRITDKIIQRCSEDPFFLIYGYRFVFLDELMSGKVKFLSPAHDRSSSTLMKRDLITGKVLDGFSDLESAFHDWKQSCLSSPTLRDSLDESSLDLELFQREYVAGSEDVDGVIWEVRTSSALDEMEHRGKEAQISDSATMDETCIELKAEQRPEEVCVEMKDPQQTAPSVSVSDNADTDTVRSKIIDEESAKKRKREEKLKEDIVDVGDTTS